jgi:hypothetical protein
VNNNAEKKESNWISRLKQRRLYNSIGDMPEIPFEEAGKRQRSDSNWKQPPFPIAADHELHEHIEIEENNIIYMT